MKRISVENMADTLAKALAAGDEKAAWSILNRAITDGLSATEVCEMVLLPALAALSRHGEISVERSGKNIVECIEHIIARLQPHLPVKDTRTPHALIVVIPDARSANPLPAIRGRVLTDLLECDGWRVSLALNGVKSLPQEKSADALIIIPTAEISAPEEQERITDAVAKLKPAHAVVITTAEYEGWRDAGILPAADEHEARRALKELIAASRAASEQNEATHMRIAESFESSDVLLCILDDNHKIITANRIARDEFGFTPGESVSQYLDAGSREMFATLLQNNNGIATELVEVGFLRHGQAYLADILLMPCGGYRAMIAYPKQGEIDRLTKILNNYNHEINRLNRELRELRGQMKRQTSALGTANAQIGAAFTKINDTRVEDPLTGAFNRKYYATHLVNEINRARRYQRSLGFLLVSVDEFDKIAKDLGRTAVDDILRAVARLITQNTRKGVDWIARVGEREFVVVLPETDMEGCLRVGEKLRNLVATYEMHFNGKLAPITISVGGASYDAMQDVPVSFQELTSRAGRALGRARREGPNAQNIEPLE